MATKKKKRITTEEEAENFLRSWLTQKLRRISYQWPARKEALRRARISRGKYRCAMCDDEDKIYGRKEIVLDHKDPVIDPFEGWIGWDEYLRRLFCPEDNWQVLCKDHHDIKTAIENEIRRDTKKENRKKEKEEDDL